MAAPVFFDSNVVVYTDDESSPEKRLIARTLLNEHLGNGTAVVSLQVLQEYFAVVTHKLGVPAELAQKKVELLAIGRVIGFEAGDVIAAIELHRLVHLSFWDALIVHAARVAGATTLYTEDLQDGWALGGVRVVNPFRKRQK